MMNLMTGHCYCPGPGRKEFELGMKIFRHIMLGHETNLRINSWGMKKSTRYSKEVHIILSVTSIKTIRSLCWTAKIGSIRKVKEISNF